MAKSPPLWPGVVVSRGFSTGQVDWPCAAAHLGYVALWVVAGTAIATRRMRGKLYT